MHTLEYNVDLSVTVKFKMPAIYYDLIKGDSDIEMQFNERIRDSIEDILNDEKHLKEGIDYCSVTYDACE